MNEIKVCALTGHRDLDQTYDQNKLYDELESLIRRGCDKFYCGMAQGFDLEALSCLVKLKEKYRIFIEACVPFNGQEERFSRDERKKYRTLIGFCDGRTVLYEHYCDGCYLARDRYMVEHADIVLAYLRRDTGGTAYTVRYAKKRGLDVLIV